MVRIYRAAVPAVALFAYGCAPGAAPPARTDPPGYIACANPRPEVCTREYRPVCAQVDTGRRCVTRPCEAAVEETRGNACSACSDPKVLGHRPGACDEAPRR